jgi:hypothetical protein
LAGSLCTSSSAPAAPASDSAVSGLSFFIAGEYPKSVAATLKLTHPIAWHPAGGTWDGRILRVGRRRGEFGPVAVLVLGVVPEPVLTRFERPDDGVPAVAPVCRGVPGQRVVATTDVATGRAAAQVNPPPADGIALGTTGTTWRDRGVDGGGHGGSVPSGERGLPARCRRFRVTQLHTHRIADALGSRHGN